MNKRMMLLPAAALLLAAAGAHAQSQMPVSPANPPGATDPQVPHAIDHPQNVGMAQKLLGMDLSGADGKAIGKVEAVEIDAAGEIKALIVGVGTELGMGARDVAIEWKSVTPSPEAAPETEFEKITTKLSDAELKALPPHEFADAKQRGTVYQD